MIVVLLNQYTIIIEYFPLGSYHALEDRLKIDRRRLEAAHLLFAALNVYGWYHDDFKDVKKSTKCF